MPKPTSTVAPPRTRHRHGDSRRRAARDGHQPAPATQKLLHQLGMTIDQFDVIELNEAFASCLAVLRCSASPTMIRA